MRIPLGDKAYDRQELDAVGAAFYKNFLLRRLVSAYGIPLDKITQAHVQHVMHDLDCIRYVAWLMVRGSGLSLADVGRLVADDAAPDVFVAVFAEPVQVVAGAGEAQIRALLDKNKKDE